MPAQKIARRLATLLCLLLTTLGLAACGTTVSTSGFKGERHAVAQAVSDLEADATAGDEKKICKNDLAAAVVAKLDGRKGCEKVIKAQLAEIDSLDVSVQSITIAAGGTNATGRVKSTYAGKKQRGQLTLVKEQQTWKVIAVR